MVSITGTKNKIFITRYTAEDIKGTILEHFANDIFIWFFNCVSLYKKSK